MTIRVGLVGLGPMVDVHLAAFRENPRFELTAVSSTIAGAAEMFMDQHNLRLRVSGTRQLLLSRDVDLVSILTPPATHASLVAMALAQGRHVISELSFVPSAADAQVLHDLAVEHGRVGALACARRFIPNLRHARDLLAQGVVGQPRLMRFVYFSNVLDQPDEDDPWMWDADSGGGVLAGYISHALDLARTWFGPIETVDGTLRTLSDVSPPEGVVNLADDTGSVVVQFKSGLLAMFQYCAVSAYPRTRIEVHGSEASLLIEGFGDEMSVLRMGADSLEAAYPPIAYLEETRGQSGLVGGFSVFLDRLADAIQSGSPPPDLPTFADGVEIMRILDGVRASAHEGRVVHLDGRPPAAA